MDSVQKLLDTPAYKNIKRHNASPLS